MELTDHITIDDKKELSDKFARVKVPKEFENNISIVYAKEVSGGKDLVVQKISTASTKNEKDRQRKDVRKRIWTVTKCKQNLIICLQTQVC